MKSLKLTRLFPEKENMKTILSFVLLMFVVGCANNQAVKDATAYLQLTPHEHCSQPATAARYANYDECKREVSGNQDKIRDVMLQYATQPRQNYQIQPYYLNTQPVAAPRTTNCTTQWILGRLQTVCQ